MIWQHFLQQKLFVYTYGYHVEYNLTDRRNWFIWHERRWTQRHYLDFISSQNGFQWNDRLGVLACKIIKFQPIVIAAKILFLNFTPSMPSAFRLCRLRRHISAPKIRNPDNATGVLYYKTDRSIYYPYHIGKSEGDRRQWVKKDNGVRREQPAISALYRCAESVGRDRCVRSQQRGSGSRPFDLIASEELSMKCNKMMACIQKCGEDSASTFWRVRACMRLRYLSTSRRYYRREAIHKRRRAHTSKGRGNQRPEGWPEQSPETPIVTHEFTESYTSKKTLLPHTVWTTSQLLQYLSLDFVAISQSKPTLWGLAKIESYQLSLPTILFDRSSSKMCVQSHFSNVGL